MLAGPKQTAKSLKEGQIVLQQNTAFCNKLYTMIDFFLGTRHGLAITRALATSPLITKFPLVRCRYFLQICLTFLHGVYALTALNLAPVLAS